MNWILSLILIFSTLCASAKITLPPIIGDHMVIQQNSVFKIWGKSDKKDAVHITCSWGDKKQTVRTDAEGNWAAEIVTEGAQTGQHIKLYDGDELIIKDILIGDVWYCSGQSNMEMPLKGMTASQPINGANDAITNAIKLKKMRIFRVDFGDLGEGADKPYHGKWQIVDAQSASEFSALAFFFGKNLTEILDIPIGMICSAKGGTRIEQWSSPIDLASFDKATLHKTMEGNSELYKQLVKPISAFKIKGILWYQGESNWDSNPKSYADIFSKLINRWRIDWNGHDLPFYFVEVAPMKKYASVDLRFSQYQVAKTIRNTGMASTIDIGEADCIHPAEKETIAKRLVYLALCNTYNMQGVHAENPTFKRYVTTQDGKIWLEFDHADFGFTPRNSIEGIEVAGDDGVFKPITADAIFIDKEQKNYIQLNVSRGMKVKYIRYGCYPWIKGNIYNTFQLPILAFNVEIN